MSGIRDLPSVGRASAPPDAEGVADAFSRIGYSIEEALADLIDNSIDAKAEHVLIRVYRSNSQIERIIVADDGSGMTERRLEEAMRFGARQPHQPLDLGRYGMGLKSASLSQCRKFSVLTHQGGKIYGRRWTLESIKDDWQTDILDSSAVAAMFDVRGWPPSRAPSGTIIVWDDLDGLRRSKQAVEGTITRLFKTIPVHLGLVFHRFIASERVSIVGDAENVDRDSLSPPMGVYPLDPFSYARTGKKGYPKRFALSLPELPDIELHAHIWPAKSKDDGYRLGGGRVAARQGFYFYRNDRLIQAGGWNGWRESDAEPHSSLARVQVDLPPEFDSVFRLKVQKSGVEVPAEFFAALDATRSEDGTSLAGFLRDADEAYRSHLDAPESPPVVPGAGIPSTLRGFMRSHLTDGAKGVRRVAIQWRRLKKAQLFEVDRDNQRVLLNSLYRDQMRGKGAKGDPVLVKTLLFLLLTEEFDRKYLTGKRRQQLEDMNLFLMMAIGLENKRG